MGYEARILVTDDDPDILLLSTTLLADEGYEVYEATTGKGCLQTARRCSPDVVLLDVQLPDMSGIDVCRRMKAEPKLRNAFVVLLSGALVSPEAQVAGLNVGADDYVVKGVTNREFLARIQSLLRIKRVEDRLRAKETAQRKVISELEKALTEIKTLKGLIPICGSCKKIRDDKGYWNEVEAYISTRTNALFSHGICPECTERLYPDYYKRMVGKCCCNG